MSISKHIAFFLVALCLSGCDNHTNVSQKKTPSVNELNSQKSALGYDSKFIELNDVTFHYVEAGSGDLIVFLHGFPYFGEVWDKLLRPFSQHYRVVAPDNRGYAYTDKPDEVTDYRIDKLVEDVKALVNQLSVNKKVILIGHDWGGVLAWAMGQQYPDMVSKVVVINAPPYNIFLKMLQESASQQEASKYIGKLSGWISKILFAIKGPELIWSSLDYLHTDGHVSDAFKQAFLTAWEQPGAGEGATNWYKANIPEFDQINDKTYWPSKDARVSVPSLLIWSKHDKAFTDDTFRAIPAVVDDLTIHIIDTKSHTPFLDHTAEVLETIDAFLAN